MILPTSYVIIYETKISKEVGSVLEATLNTALNTSLQRRLKRYVHYEFPIIARDMSCSTTVYKLNTNVT